MLMEVGLLAKRLIHSGAKRPVTGIVHLGLGAFFRAFGCVYIADAMKASGGDWGVIGVSLRSPKIRNSLRDQGWAYTSVSLETGGEILNSIEVINDVLVAPENPCAVLDVMTEPTVKIVTLTVTEKGYCYNPSAGVLNPNHPDIQHDLTHTLPSSAIGYLVRALQVRRERGFDPFTVLTCDNLPNNGKLVRGLVLEMARLIDPLLADWIEVEGRFPCCMVDRITPATTQIDIERLENLTGYFDAAPVMHEAFSQWAIEDDFVNGDRPDFAAAGVALVTDVTAYEHMKLRMLNGTHSALAYTGYLAGHKTISDTVSDPVFSAFARALWAEMMPVVTAPPDVILLDYADALLDRYANPNIQHRTWQIAMDGSQKLPQRILGTISDAFDMGLPTPMLCLSIAGWMRYVGGTDEADEPIDVKDPLAVKLRRLSDRVQTPQETVAALLSLDEIFPTELAEQLLLPVTQVAITLWKHGARHTINEILTKNRSTFND